MPWHDFCWKTPHGRLRRDATPAQVETALASAAARLRERFPGSSDVHYLTPSMQDTAVAGARLGLLLLFGAVALVLLIVCANVGILMLARGQGRARELAIRAALGASRRRLAGQLLAESAILATAGVALGLLVAEWATDALQALRPGSLPSARVIAIDGRGVVFAALVAVAACVLFGVLPALLTTRSLEPLRDSVGSSPRRQRARRVLVTAELALTLVLLVGAGLLGKSLLELERVRPGFRPEGVLSFQLNLPEARYADDKQVVAFYEELLHQIEGMPGVQAAAVSMSVPPDWLVMSNDFFLPDRPPAAGEQAPVAPFTS